MRILIYRTGPPPRGPLMSPSLPRPANASNCTPRALGLQDWESLLHIGPFLGPYNHSANAVWSPGILVTGLDTNCLSIPFRKYLGNAVRERPESYGIRPLV